MSYWVKSDRDGEISYDVPHMWNLKKKNTNELSYKTETHRLTEQTYGSRRDKGGKG